MLQNATPLRKSLPWTATISDEHVSCIAPATRNASLQIPCKRPTPAIVFGNAAKASHSAHFFGQVQSPLRLPRKTTSEPSKVVRACGAFGILTWQRASRHNSVRSWCVLHILTWKRALRHMCVQFFDISTSTSCLPLVCFVRSKCASCHDGVHFFDISTSKVVQRWCVLYILTSKCASRHNGVQLFISHLARWLHTRRSNHWKNTVNRDFLTCSRTCIMHLLSSHSFSSLIFFFFFSLTLPTSAFPSVHIFVGSLTSKLPSTRPHRHFEQLL